ncbi:hypothetical protein WMF27_40670 [Sorangium sp. So ce281]|uniref:hypothetical protein n=1 Tax=unclassified Sorangium TaxID=2621164 RepID=UPI003F62814B
MAAGKEHRGEVERGGGVELAPAIRFQLYHLVARIEENSVGVVIAKASAAAVGDDLASKVGVGAVAKLYFYSNALRRGVILLGGRIADLIGR